MGMTDRQFDAYRKDQLRLLQKAKKEVQEVAEGKIKKSPTLETMIEDTEEFLKRP